MSREHSSRSNPVPRRVLAAGLAAVATLTCAGPGWSAEDETQWAVQEIIVTARRQEPVLWRVSRGDAEVWIIGSVPVMPKDQVWSSRRLERLVEGSRLVLTGPEATVNPFSAIGVLSRMGLPDGQSLDQGLPPDLLARFAAARELARQGPGRYARNKPVWAAWRLLGDYHAAANLTTTGPSDLVIRIARHSHVPVRPIASYDAKTVMNNLADLPAAQSQACLADAIADVEFAQDHARAAGQAWAAGDLKGVIANYAEPKIDACLQQSPTYNALVDRSVDDMVKTIDAALAKPGTTVAVFSLRYLLQRDGALERLRAQGVTVSAPEL